MHLRERVNIADITPSWFGHLHFTNHKGHKGTQRENVAPSRSYAPGVSTDSRILAYPGLMTE